MPRDDRSGPVAYERRPLRWGGEIVHGLSTVQLHIGGLFDSEPVGEAPIHLVRHYAVGGTPGTLLCGLDHHALPVGFSVGGGSCSPSLGDADPATAPCPTCVKVAARMALGVEELGVSGGVGGERAVRAIAAELERMGAADNASVATFDSWKVARSTFEARRSGEAPKEPTLADAMTDHLINIAVMAGQVDAVRAICKDPDAGFILAAIVEGGVPEVIMPLQQRIIDAGGADQRDEYWRTYCRGFQCTTLIHDHVGTTTPAELAAYREEMRKDPIEWMRERTDAAVAEARAARTAEAARG